MTFSPLIETIFPVHFISLYWEQKCSTRCKSQPFKMKIQVARVSNLLPCLRWHCRHFSQRLRNNPPHLFITAPRVAFVDDSVLLPFGCRSQQRTLWSDLGTTLAGTLVRHPDSGEACGWQMPRRQRNESLESGVRQALGSSGRRLWPQGLES